MWMKKYYNFEIIKYKILYNWYERENITIPYNVQFSNIFRFDQVRITRYTLV